MAVRAALCSALLYLATCSPTAFAAETVAGVPAAELGAEVVLDPEGMPSRVKGHLSIDGKAAGEDGTLCIRLPYEDAAYGQDRGTGRRLEMFTDRHGKLVFDGGATTLTLPDGATMEPSDVLPGALRIKPAGAGPVVLAFESIVPRLPATSADDWFYDGFFPEVLNHCTVPARARSLSLSVNLKTPQGWTYAGPATPQTLTARTFAFALAKDFRRTRVKAGSVDVDVYFRTPDFIDILPTIMQAMPRMEQLFGPYPFKTMTLVETTELQRNGLPGLLVMNKPAQALFSSMQSTLLNWPHWIVSAQLARQWYGAAVVAEDPDDDWLTEGTIEFAALETLRTNERRFNLFNPTESGWRLFSFDYQQIAEISAATLRRFAPFAALTTAELKSRDNAAHQHPLLFVKHTFALKQMQGFAGEPAFSNFLRGFTTRHLHGTVTPNEFAAYLDRKPSPFPPATRQKLPGFLRRWWTAEGWPDFHLVSFDSEPLPDGRFAAKVVAVQEGEVDFPPIVGVRDDAGGQTFIRAQAGKTEDDKPAWVAEVVTREPPVEAAVDPSHEAFDTDRFNNSSSYPGVSFFPGGANTLRDDDYTVVWLPYALRRPGEPFTFGLQAAGFRYIQGGLYLKGETAPSEHLNAFSIRQRYQIVSKALHGDLSIDQDYDDDRTTEASVVRAPLFNGDPFVSTSLKVRRKQHVGAPLTAHETGVFGLTFKSAVASQTCYYHVSGEIERAPPEFAHGFSYERRTAQSSFDCGLAPRVNVAARIFGGTLSSTGSPPQQAYFDPIDLKEARLLVDKDDIPVAKKVTSGSVDLLLPFSIPLPTSTMILSRQMRYRLFYDAGRSYQPLHTYRSAGMGLSMPFGGDLTGAGSLALTKLTVLGILWSKTDNVEIRKPSVVFDITGDL